MFFGRRVRRASGGRFRIAFAEEERALLGRLVPDLRALLLDDAAERDPSLRRLFPTAYPDDPARDAEYHRLVHGDLLDRRQAALDTVEATLDATDLDEEGLLAWMTAINDLRLVIGTRLDVSEDDDPRIDPDDPDAGLRLVYHWLSELLADIVDALGGAR